MSQVAACKSPLVKKLVVFLFPVLLAACGGGNNDAAQGGELANPPTPTTGEWQLVWEDDFDGEALNPLNWEVQVGDGSSYGIPGWGNNERQYYTAENLSLADGLLTIEARSEDQGYDYTSGRIRTQGLVDFTYGRVEGRMKLPKGQGLWSAFWMLGSDATAYGTWAARGEIDIVEYFLSGSFGSSVHFGGVAPGNTSVSGIFDEFDVGNEFHTYAVEWDAERIRFFIDGENFYTVTSATYWNYYYKSLGEGFVVGDESAPFDRDQHILLNLAVGGNLPGDPDATTVFPAQMQVDYVRVYECPVNTATGTGCAGSIDPVNYYIDFEVPAQAPVISSYELYSDGPSTLFDETELYRDLTISAYTAEGALSWTEVPDENGELVLDIVTSGGGNVALADANEGSTFRLVNMGDTTNPLSSAEFKFSAKVISSETDSQGRIQFKLDSGFPDVAFYEMSIGDLPQDQWGTVSIRLSDILSGGQGAYGGGPADVNALVNLFVVELTGAAHIQIADLALVCGAPGFCGIEQVAVNPLVIFDNAVGDAWTRGIIGYDTTVDGDYDVAQGNHVSWEIRDSGEEGYEQVIRTTFSDGLASGGVTFIGADSGVDINPWAAGELVFDVRVVSTPNDAPQELIYKLDGPELATTTGERSLGELTVGEWNTFRVPVATLAAYGLDITNVSAFVLFPTFGGQDVVYEWDNVRIETTVTPQPAAAGEIFTSSFEDLTPVAEAEGASIGSGWLTFVSVLGAEGYAYNDGAPFAAPNGGLISQIDVVDGNQVLNVYSDYGNADGQGKGMVTSVFQEYVIGETISGDLVFTFEAYRPEGGLAEGATASAFMTVLDPENNYNLVVQEVLVLNSTLSGEFQTFTVTLPQGSPGLESGLLLQFGFRSETIDYAGTGVLYDNIRLTVDSASGDDEDAGGDDGGDGGGNEPPAAASFEFTADFEAADETAGTIPGWNFFGSDVNGGYGPFAAPNGTGSVANIEGGQGGTEQGDLYLNVFSDYNNGNGNAGPVTAAVFREFTIVASDAGTYRMSVDAKRNDSGPIAAPSIGNVFVKRLDPANGYATVFEENVDVVEISQSEWTTLTIDFTVEASQAGQLIQFGFFNSVEGYASSSVLYDNVVVEAYTPPTEATFEFESDFEAADETAGTIPGWNFFGSDVNGGYGPFAAPNGTGSVANIEGGQGGTEQGDLYLNVFSDYNNGNGNAGPVTAAVFREFTIVASDAGTYRMSVDAKRNDSGPIAAPSIGNVFVKRLDPANGYATVFEENVDVVEISQSEWTTLTIDFTVEASQAGQLIQFGFFNSVEGYASSSVLYDNVVVEAYTPPTEATFEFESDFEAADETAGTIPGWNFFGSDVNGGYGPFAAPNGTGSVANIEGGQGGTEQGDLYLNVFSDYNNGNGNAGPVTAAVFREFTIVASDAGTYRMSVDAKRNDSGPIAAPSIGNVFVKRLDPANGYATVFEENVDVVEISQSEWTTLTIDFTVEASQAGQLIQFGFFNSVQGYAPSSVLYDNVSVSRAAQ